MTVRTSSLNRGALVAAPRRRGRWLLLLTLAAVAAAVVGGLTFRGSPGHSNSPAYRFSQTRIEGSPTMYSLLSENGEVVAFLQDGQIWTRPVAGGPRTLVTADLAGQPSGPFDYPLRDAYTGRNQPFRTARGLRLPGQGPDNGSASHAEPKRPS